MSVTSWIRRQFKDNVSPTDTVPAGFSNIATSFTAADGTTFPDGSVGPFIITADQGLATEEKILIQSRSGAVFTVATSGRGYGTGGATAQTHGSNCSILHTLDAQDLDEANQAVVQTLGAVTASGDLLVGSGAHALAKLARGSANQFLTTVGTTLQWISFGAGRSQSVGSANANGTDTTPARSDHAHAGVTSFNGAQGVVTGVASFNTRTGAVTLGAGDLTGLAVASLNGGTGALSQTNGYGVTGADANPPVPAVALTSAAGHLAGDYNTTGSLATYLTTASLGIGTWHVRHAATVLYPSGDAGIELHTGTATATFEGTQSTEVRSDASSDNATSTAVLDVIATVTVAGTLVFQAVSATTFKPVVKATTVTDGAVKATGYTAVRIA